MAGIGNLPGSFPDGHQAVPVICEASRRRDGGLKLYFTVKLTWIVLGTGTVLVAVIAWKRPKAVVPLTLAIATAGVLAAIMRL